MNEEKKQGKIRVFLISLRSPRVIAIICGIVVLLAAIALFFANRWEIVFDPASGQTDTVEAPSLYQAPDVTARLRGRLFFRKGVSLSTSFDGAADGGKTGSYELTWAARWLWIEGVCTRTVNVVDTTPPVIALVEETREYVLPDGEYDDPGFTAKDAVDGDLTDKVLKTPDGDKMIYTVADRAGNVASVTRVIPYKDPEPPVITLKGDKTVTVEVGKGYKEAGYTATDNLDGDLTDKVVVTGDFNKNVAGVYTLIYTVEDAHRNIATAKRTVIVRAGEQEAPADPASGAGKVIFLTFDDGPGPYTPKLLDVLKKYGVKATFFVTGNGQTDLIAREAAEGHTVAIHTMTHDYARLYASEEAYFKDLNAINEIIKQQTGSYSYLLRFPGGSSNTVSRRYCPGIMTKLARSVQEKGYHYFDWNVDSNDAGGAASADAVYRNVINGASGRAQSVVLQHDIKGFSVDAVERIIQWGKANGYTFAPLTASSPGAHHGINN